MANRKGAFGAASTLTCTLASLASSATAGREGVVVDNSSDLYLDALVALKVKLQAGTIANDQAVYVFCYGTADDGTTYPDKITAADAAITFDSPMQLALLGTIWTPTQSLTYKGGPWSVAKALGGFLPKKWGIAIRNYSGIAFDATEGNHAKLWQGYYETIT